MIARRIIAVFLGVAAFCAIIVAALFLRVNETVFSPEFYNKQVRDSNIFNFLYDEALPLALDDYSEDGALSFGDTMSADIQLDLRPVKPQLISTLKEMVPPEYLEENARVFIDAFVPYLAKDTDSFVVEVPISDRITAAGAALKTLIADDRVIEFLYDEFSLEIAMEVIKDGITFDLDVTAQDLVDAVRGTAPDDWLQQQLTLAVDSITPYLAGESETFSIAVPVNERIDDARAELKALLSNWDAREYIFAEIVDPPVNGSIGAGISVPFQLTVTPQDVKSTLREVLSRDWADRRIAELVDTIVDYASGRQGTFRLEMPLRDRKAVAVTSVGRLMESRLEALFSTIPVCTQQQLASINVQDFPRTGIVCRPPSLGLSDIKAVTGLADYDRQVAALVNYALPDTFLFNEAGLRSTLSQHQWDLLQNVRGWLRDGYSFTQDDLEEALAKADYPKGALAFDDLDDGGKRRARESSGYVQSLRDARDSIKKGGRFTNQDLEERLEREDPQIYQDLQSFRDNVKRARGLSFLAWIIPAVFLVIVGSLGGRRIPAKVIWGVAPLLIASLCLILTSVAFSEPKARMVDRLESEVAEQFTDHSPLETAMVGKALEIGVNVVDEFRAGIVRRALILLVVSGVVTATSAGFLVFTTRRQSSSHDPWP